MIGYDQDPGEKIFYELAVLGDTVTASNWTITPSAGVTIGAPTHFTEGTVAGSRALVGPFPEGSANYTLTAHIDGGSGQSYERSFVIRVASL